MKRVLSVTVAVACLAMASLCYAQNFTLYGGLAMPRGDFGDNDLDNNDAGFAKTGLVLGGEYAIPMGSPGLFGVIGVSMVRNSFDEDVFQDAAGDEFSFDIGPWYNVPIMAGLKYQSEMSPGMRFYATGQVGLNIIKGPKFEESSAYYGESVEITWDTANSFGFGIGGGVVINDKINLGIRYLSLGEADLEGTVDWTGDGDSGSEDVKWEDEDMFDGVPPLSILLLTVGIEF